MRKLLAVLLLSGVGISFFLLLPRINARYLVLIYSGLAIYLILRTWWKKYWASRRS